MVTEKLKAALARQVALQTSEALGSMLDGTDAVFLVGTSGVGKTLTLNFLAGREIIEVVDEDGFDHLDVADTLRCVSTVGHYGCNTTGSRAFHDASSNLAFVDWPSDWPFYWPFVDTVHDSAEFITEENLVYLATLASTVRRPATVRLVVLISVKMLLLGPRDTIFRQILPVLYTFLGDLPKHQQSVLVFFTHCGDVPTDQEKVAQRVTALMRNAATEASAASVSGVNDRDKSTQFAPIFLQHVLDLIGKHNELLFLQPTASETRAKVKQLILDTPPMDTSEVATHCPAQSRPAPSAPSLGSPPSPGVLHAQPTPLPRCH